MNHAKFAQAAYTLNMPSLKNNQRIERANAIIGDDYKTHEASNRNVSLYMNDKTKEAVISHRGTAFNNKHDLAGDLAFIFGNEAHSKEFDKRRNRSEKILKHVPKDYKLHMNGYSYGGATAIDALVNSPKLRKRVDGEVHLYNPLSKSSYNPKIILSKNESIQDAKHDLNKKIITHRTQHDIVSIAGSPFGETRTHEAKYKHHGVMPEFLKPAFETINQLQTHSIKNFV